MSDKINDGGSAFPHSTQWDGITPAINHNGMTLRDYFAAAALQGLLAGYLHRAKLDNEGALMIPKSMHLVAYNCADEMIKAKEAKP